MKRSDRRGKIMRYRGIGIKIIAVYFFLLYMVIILVLQEVHAFRLRGELSRVTAQVRLAHEYRASLYNQIDIMNTDAYVEKVAREQLGLQRQGEIPVSPDGTFNNR